MISLNSEASSTYKSDGADFDPFAGPAIAQVVPSTEPQREIWTATRIGDDASLAFNESTSLRLRGPLDRDALAAAIRGIVARHEALRATFSDDGMSMMIQESLDSQLTVHDLTTLASEARAARVDKVLKASVVHPFDLLRGPLVR